MSMRRKEGVINGVVQKQVKKGGGGSGGVRR